MRSEGSEIDSMEISPTAAGFEPVDLFNGMQGELSRADSSENAVEIGW